MTERPDTYFLIENIHTHHYLSVHPNDEKAEVHLGKRRQKLAGELWLKNTNRYIPLFYTQREANAFLGAYFWSHSRSNRERRKYVRDYTVVPLARQKIEDSLVTSGATLFH